MGWHEILYNQRLLPLLLGNPVRDKAGKEVQAPYAGQMKMFDAQTSEELRRLYPDAIVPGSTSNFMRMAAAGWLLWSIRYGTELDQSSALEWVWEILKREDIMGMDLREQLACDPHAQFHLGAEVAIRIAAKEGKLPGLLAKSDVRWRQRRALWALLATPEGEIYSPATRAGSSRLNQRVPPAHQVSTAIYRELAGIPQAGVLKGMQWWQDKTWGLGPASVARKMHREGDSFGAAYVDVAKPGDIPDGLPAWPAGTLPKLRLPLNIIRTQHGHSAWFEGSKENEPICDWVDIEYGKQNKVAYGFDFEAPFRQHDANASIVRIA